MRKLLWFTLGLAVGCALCVYLLPVRWQLPALAAAVALLGLCLFLPERFRFFAVCSFVGLCVGIVWYTACQLLFPAPDLAYEGETREVIAEVCGIPEQKAHGVSVQTNLSLDGKKVKAYLTLTDPDTDLLPGDIIEGTYKLRPSRVGYNGTVYYSYVSRGIQITGNSKSYTVSHPEKTRIGLLPLVLARKLNCSLERFVPGDCLGFLQSVTTGDRTNLPEKDRNSLSVSGASHVIAISGMHVSMLVMIILFVLGKGRRAAAVICIPILLFFVLMTGASPSVVRAAVMQLILVLAQLFWRENDPPTSLSAAACVLLFQNPAVIANVSFRKRPSGALPALAFQACGPIGHRQHLRHARSAFVFNADLCLCVRIRSALRDYDESSDPSCGAALLCRRPAHRLCRSDPPCACSSFGEGGCASGKICSACLRQVFDPAFCRFADRQPAYYLLFDYSLSDDLPCLADAHPEI